MAADYVWALDGERGERGKNKPNYQPGMKVSTSPHTDKQLKEPVVGQISRQSRTNTTNTTVNSVRYDLYTHTGHE